MSISTKTTITAKAGNISVSSFFLFQCTLGLVNLMVTGQKGAVALLGKHVAMVGHGLFTTNMPLVVTCDASKTYTNTKIAGMTRTSLTSAFSDIRVQARDLKMVRKESERRAAAVDLCVSNTEVTNHRQEVNQQIEQIAASTDTTIATKTRTAGTMTRICATIDDTIASHNQIVSQASEVCNSIVIETVSASETSQTATRIATNITTSSQTTLLG